MFRSRLVHALMIGALLVTGGLLFGDRALAIQDSEDKVWFGPVGVGVGQGARISVYGLGSSGTGTVPLPTLPWEFTIRIFNRRGDIVQERQFRVATGAISSFEINLGDSNEFPIDRLGRRTLRAEIVGFNPQPDPPGKYAATFEVYSLLSGHTSILIGNADVLPAALTFPGTGTR
jgi:hypothetical protein